MEIPDDTTVDQLVDLMLKDNLMWYVNNAGYLDTRSYLYLHNVSPDEERAALRPVAARLLEEARYQDYTEEERPAAKAATEELSQFAVAPDVPTAYDVAEVLVSREELADLSTVG